MKDYSSLHDDLNADQQSKLSEAFGGDVPAYEEAIDQFLLRVCRQYSDKIALVSIHQDSADFNNLLPPSFLPSLRINNSGYIRWTHGQLLHIARALARGLRASGVQPGSAIALMLPTGVEWVLFLYAAILLRCPLVPLNIRALSNGEIVRDAVKSSRATVVVASEAKVAVQLDGCLPLDLAAVKLKIVVEDGQNSGTDSWKSLKRVFESAMNAEQQPPFPSFAAHDPALIMFTSGTTSLPKGMIHSSKMLGAGITSTIKALQLHPGSSVCAHMPLYHIGGISMVMSFIFAGGAVVFPSVAFDPARSLEAIHREKCTNIPLVGPMLQAVGGSSKLKSVDTSSVHSIQMGAMMVLPEHVKLAGQIFRGCTVTNAFAATEGVPITIEHHDPSRISDEVSVGSVCSGARIRVCSPNSRDPVPRGQPGEIHMGGPQVIASYLGGRSADSFYKDSHGRWFVTGDQAYMEPNGRLFISGRYKDLIIRGGENIAPASIEAVIEAKFGMTAQVIGVKDDIAGEVPIAILKPQAGQNMPPAGAIREVVVSSLGPLYAPEQILSLQDLKLDDYPRTASGKVRKVDLKKILGSQQRAGNGTGEAPQHSNSRAVMTRLWSQILGIDSESIESTRSIDEFADSLSIMRLKTQIVRETGIELDLTELNQAKTIHDQIALLDAGKGKKVATKLAPSIPIRKVAPGLAEILPALGDVQRYSGIKAHVTEAILPLGFSWEADVEDILPTWDLGHCIFGSINGAAPVNFRSTVATKRTSVDELKIAVCRVLENHPMQRSFEVIPLEGEAPLRAVMRANDKWFQHSIRVIPEVENIHALTELLHNGQCFASNDYPYTSFQVTIAPLKVSNSAGLIWSSEHSAFDGLSLYAFLEDLDAILSSPSNSLTARFPYKPWADMYYSNRRSILAQRSVRQAVKRLEALPIVKASIFPSTTEIATREWRSASFRKTSMGDPYFVETPDLVELRTEHGISPFIVIKAALSLFLAQKTGQQQAVFAQIENGRSWPNVEGWVEHRLPDCLNVAGPTLSRTVQIISIFGSNLLEFLHTLAAKSREEAADIHAPWSLIRDGLEDDAHRMLFDAASLSTGLNYLPVRTENGVAVFREMVYHGTLTNCECAWMLFCGIEGQGRDTRLWTRPFAVEAVVSSEKAMAWSAQVLSMAAWMCKRENWTKDLSQCPGM